METTSYLIQKLVIKKPCKGRKHFGLKKVSYSACRKNYSMVTEHFNNH